MPVDVYIVSGVCLCVPVCIRAKMNIRILIRFRIHS